MEFPPPRQEKINESPKYIAAATFVRSTGAEESNSEPFAWRL